MTQTVVGVFDRYAAAQNAATLLKDSGIDPDCIHVEGMQDQSSLSLDDGRKDDGILARVKNFFAGVVDDDDDDTVSTYSEAVRRGGAVVKVDVDEEPDVDLARQALVSAGAVDIEEKAEEWRRSGWSSVGEERADEPLQSARTPAAGKIASLRSEAGEEVIPVVREELEVGKREVQAGGVRVFARAVEERVSENVQLREERARVERRPVNRPASAADLDALQDRTIEVTESVERPVVQKSAKVVEEVVVGKDVRQKNATIEDTLRHTEVDVQRLGGDQRERTYEDFEAGYRDHFQSRFAQGERYEDYEPAYRFGNSLRSDQRYAGRSWDDVENEAGRDWATRYPQSPWERAKDAVRHAWDRATAD